MIVIIGVLGFVLDVGFEKLRRMARRLGRAGAPDRGGHDMTARAPHAEACGRRAADRAPVLALWHSLAAFGHGAAVAAAGAADGLPAPDPSSSAIRSSCRHAATTLFRLFAGFRHCGRDRRDARRLRRPGSRTGRGAAAAAGARAGAGAEDRALSGLHPHPRLRAFLQDRTGGRPTRCSRSCSPPIRAPARSNRSSSGRRGRPARRRRKAACSRSCLPAALPSVLTGCRIGLVISCIVVFLAEMITSTDGLGHLLVLRRAHLPDRRHVRAA